MKVIGYIFVFFLCSVGFAQDMVIYDSEADIEHVDLYNKKGHKQTNRDSIYFYHYRAILIAEKIQYHQGHIDACEALIEFYKNDEEIYKRLEYDLLLVQLYNKHGSSDDKVDAYFNLGKTYFNENLFEKAVETFIKASEITDITFDKMYRAHIWLVRSQFYVDELDKALITARELEFNENISTYQKIELQKEKAAIYHGLRAYDKELESYQTILEHTKDAKYTYLKAATLNNIGYTQKYLKNYNPAKKAFLSCISVCQNSHDELEAAAYYNLGLIYHNDRNIDSALFCFEQAQGLYTVSNKMEEVANSLNMQAISYHHLNDQFNGQKKLNEAFTIEKEHQLLKQESRSHEIQSYIHADLFEFELALASFKRHLSIESDLNSTKNSEEERLKFVNYQADQLERGLRLIWSNREKDIINQAKERAEEKARQKDNELKISSLENKELKAKEEYNRLKLAQEKLNVENKEKELIIIQRDNKLKQLALERERLLVSEKEKENKFLAQTNELEKQLRLNEEQSNRSRLRQIAGVFVFILVVLLAILIAYRQLRKQKNKILAQNIIIAEEKERSEELLLNILPKETADELKEFGSAKAKSYDLVSVLFTDFKGFTMISEILTPEELVAEIDYCYKEFDRIIDKFNIEKIKTIGDAYMCAGGLPVVNKSHAGNTVDAALEIRDFMLLYKKQREAEGKQGFEIRIGIHTGPVVAGIVGIKKFAYDIWGDAVNTAARMESSGSIGKVNVSGFTYGIIKDDFNCEYRGKVAAKNKGEIEMYYVEKK